MLCDDLEEWGGVGGLIAGGHMYKYFNQLAALPEETAFLPDSVALHRPHFIMSHCLHPL